jgi:alkaline phosphatase isozyme conversion protein
MLKPSRLCRLAFFLLIVSLIWPLAGCSGSAASASETKPVAAYGDYGSKLALELAARYPFRSPGSDQEAGARDYLAAQFKELGYKVTVQKFTFANGSGESIPSANLIVRIRGKGVPAMDDQGKTTKESRQVLVGAHYDVRISAAAAAADSEEAQTTTTASGKTQTRETQNDTVALVPSLKDFDGIHDNASGVGTLLALARQLRGRSLDHDVVLVAFGAGTADQAGAKAYLHSMSADDISRTDAMYNIDAIYAGDKVYAHAGQNSVLPGDRKVYALRRKLYEVTDVFFEYTLYSRNGYNLLTNQSSIPVPLGDSGETALYREWTQHRSDHLPFDKAGIPIVFFESYDYDYSQLEDMKESKNPALASTGGQIRDTAFDSTEFLSYLLSNTAAAKTRDSQTAPVTSEDRLTLRINNTAFVILESIDRNTAIHGTESSTGG